MGITITRRRAPCNASSKADTQMDVVSKPSSMAIASMMCGMPMGPLYSLSGSDCTPSYDITVTDDLHLLAQLGPEPNYRWMDYVRETLHFSKQY